METGFLIIVFVLSVYIIQKNLNKIYAQELEKKSQISTTPPIYCFHCQERIYDDFCYDQITKLPIHNKCLYQLDLELERKNSLVLVV